MFLPHICHIDNGIMVNENHGRDLEDELEDETFYISINICKSGERNDLELSHHISSPGRTRRKLNYVVTPNLTKFIRELLKI